MSQLATIRELFAHDDWGTGRMVDAAATLSDKQLDREFDMGHKSLRATLNHIHTSRQVWLQRLVDGVPSYDELFASLDDAGLQRMVNYRDRQGNEHTTRAFDILLHVANHGTYHRAQMLNMLRHLGAKPPRIDYIFRYFEQSNLPAPTLSIDAVKYYYKCTDWARDRALSACERLTDEQLDRAFEMGIGSIRAALSHIEDAERWWLQNWIGEAPGAFPQPSKTDTIAKLRERFDATATRRNAIIDSLKSDDDLKRMVEAKPWPDRTVRFPLGVILLQLCGHGTHHRAQIFNMLKHVGGAVPGIDIILMTRS